jgi:hypothetical protein
MPPTFPRRKFLVGAGAATGGALAIPLHPLVLAEPRTQTHIVSDELLTQLDRHLRSFVATPRGEHLRSIANTLRALAVHEVATGGNDDVQRTIREVLRRQGENALLSRDPDWKEIEARAKRYGLALQREPPDFTARKRALDAVLKGGLAAEWQRVAGLFDQVAQTFDQRGLVAFRQDQCYFIRQQLQQLEWLAMIACLSPCTACCVAATLTYIAWAATAQANGC